jgi:hypothetical protein
MDAIGLDSNEAEQNVSQKLLEAEGKPNPTFARW